MLVSLPRNTVSVSLGLGLNFFILTSGFYIFNHYALLVDAASIFIVLSGVITSLISSALTEIAKQQTTQLEQEYKNREYQAYKRGWQAANQGEPLENIDNGSLS